MNFTEAQTAISTLLGNNAGGQFRVCGYRNEPADAKTVKDTNASVAVYYGKGDFSKANSPPTGPFEHSCTFNIELTISTAAKADLTTLNDDGSTPAERQTALSNIQNTRALADQALNALINVVWNIIFNAEHIGFEETLGKYRDRWVPTIEKQEVGYIGDLIVSQATMHLNLDVQEIADGDLGTALEVLNLTLNLEDEPTDGQAGIEENY